MIQYFLKFSDNKATWILFYDYKRHDYFIKRTVKGTNKTEKFWVHEMNMDKLKSRLGKYKND